MTDLYLIAHKVRNEPAFDVAQRMTCPDCDGHSAQSCIDGPIFCSECDDLGYWWIVPTSGHRAYPFNVAALSEDSMLILEVMPEDLPDHYTTAYRPEPTTSLIDRLGLKPTKPATTTILRRL